MCSPGSCPALQILGEADLPNGPLCCPALYGPRASDLLHAPAEALRSTFVNKEPALLCSVLENQTRTMSHQVALLLHQHGQAPSGQLLLQNGDSQTGASPVGTSGTPPHFRNVQVSRQAQAWVCVVLCSSGWGRQVSAGRIGGWSARTLPHLHMTEACVQCSAMTWHSIAASCEAAAGVADSSDSSSQDCHLVQW